MNVKEFINQVLLGEYSEIVPKFPYISFALIGLGIEFLGACLDCYEFDKIRQSGARVQTALTDLFPAAYNIPGLGSDLRNGFAHQFRPGMSLELSQRSEAPGQGWKHLEETSDGKICLVAEDLYADFVTACRTVLTKIDSGELSHKKFSRGFLRV
jgi:hypothetical protein